MASTTLDPLTCQQRDPYIKKIVAEIERFAPAAIRGDLLELLDLATGRRTRVEVAFQLDLERLGDTPQILEHVKKLAGHFGKPVEATARVVVPRPPAGDDPPEPALA